MPAGARRWLGLALAGAALAAACSGGSSAAGERPTATTGPVEVLGSEPLPAGYRLLDGGDLGYTVGVPGPWKDMPFDDEAITALIVANRESNPGLARLLEARRRTAGSNLLVLDDRPPGANLNVFRVPNERPLTPEEVDAASAELLDPARTAAIDQQLMSMSASDVTRARVRLPAGLAVRVTYRLRVGEGGAASMVSGLLYYVPTPAAVYVLSLSTTDPSAYEADFGHVARSFALKA